MSEMTAFRRFNDKIYVVKAFTAQNKQVILRAECYYNVERVVSRIFHIYFLRTYGPTVGWA